MELRFRGESVHRVDAKGRVSVPASFRRVLELGDPDWVEGGNPSFVLIYGLDGTTCLNGYTKREADRLGEKIANMPYGTMRKRMERRLMTQSAYLTLDDNGRFVLSQALRDQFGITDEAKFAGMNEKFEIWTPAAFEADQALLDAEDDAQGINLLEALNAPRQGV
ncbi:cell division/cell wall cluster transcriptional repressor MraZ [Abyssibius alkaniclasticus]|uniref:division/cell wall cluster transcriptional repressor MraZ n=1 Tax=Abyssibius alkaniclasticus TaxID=2881234 RepID=UPI002363467D|nr:cell division/cell wall cluster transcriptional repressor MraZ [Abyssibius alkaniclasticus]UPH69917.1 cell division/cell wall cluster transcriptional repressor MraZ [Abyssibius alkaniclasticus]